MILTPSDKLNELCTRATRAWGEEAQIRMLQEECGECSVAVNHLLDRNREGARASLITEVVDVLLMAMQARMILGSDEVDAVMQMKLDRLDDRLTKHGH